jgi:GNAT superfamily N-acetyltransferase
MGLIPVADDEVATIVTTLEMLERPRPRALPESSLRLARWENPSADKYRALFRRVGAPWLWFSRLVMDDRALLAIIHDPEVAVYAVVDRAGIEVGMLELDFRTAGQCELAYVGLIPELTGKGHGRWLMALALAHGWRAGTERLWVHTCTLDHPSALNFYRASGFVPIKRTIETFVDPRTNSMLPPESAPQIPRLGTASRR